MQIKMQQITIVKYGRHFGRSRESLRHQYLKKLYRYQRAPFDLPLCLSSQITSYRSFLTELETTFKILSLIERMG